MTAETLAAAYVEVVDQVRELVQALAEGRWEDGADAADGLVASAGYLAEAATAAGEDEASISPRVLPGFIVRRVQAGIGDRGVLEALDSALAGVVPGKAYAGLEGLGGFHRSSWRRCRPCPDPGSRGPGTLCCDGQRLPRGPAPPVPLHRHCVLLCSA